MNRKEKRDLKFKSKYRPVNNSHANKDIKRIHTTKTEYFCFFCNAKIGFDTTPINRFSDIISICGNCVENEHFFLSKYQVIQQGEKLPNDGIQFTPSRYLTQIFIDYAKALKELNN